MATQLTTRSLTPTKAESRKSFAKFFLIASIFAITCVAVGIYWRKSSTAPNPNIAASQIPTIKKVIALGRLEPASELIQVSAPNSNDGNRIEHLLVKEGDQVKVGQVIAILESRDRLQTSLQKAQKEAEASRSRLAQVKAGAKRGDIIAQQAKYQASKAELEGQITMQRATIANLQAEQEGEKMIQQATIERLKIELNNAQTECQRYEFLYDSGAVSAQSKDNTCLKADTANQLLQEAKANFLRIVNSRNEQILEAKANLQRVVNTQNKQIEEAKASLNSIAEVRPVDVEVAQADLAVAEATVAESKTNLDLSYIRAPRTGQIIKVNTWEGEIVGDDGIVTLGQTQKMYAIAEVYESDITKIHVGQSAQIKSDSFPNSLKGTVEQIGLQVLKQNVINTDPSANIDARVIEVKIRLDQVSSLKVASLTNLQVMVDFEL